MLDSECLCQLCQSHDEMCNIHMQTQPSTSEEGPELEVSPPMSRRTLELLVYLARHQPRLAREIPFQLVPGPPTEQIPVVEVGNQHHHVLA